ncbi:MAG TPA: gamma carbonic anhydrase family protein [Chloroflexota bacterium]|nr:gamma carbonic anhydrase family protein [Chloroflexota bacterium]
MPILPYLGTLPTLADDVMVDAEGFVIGKVVMGPGGRVEPRAVVRGDQSYIQIGRRFKLGASATVHVDVGYPTIIGDDVVIEERAVVHACTMADAVLVEREATVLSHSVIGEGSIIQAGSLVPEGREIPARSVVAGTPGRVIRQTTDEEVAAIRQRASSPKRSV